MSLSRFFSKPRWQSKDDAVRRSAVAQDTDAELIEALPRLAREDADAGVRIAAMKRLADPGLTQAMASDDRDEGVRKAARNLWAELLAGTHAAAPALADRLRLLRAQDDPRLIEQIATSAPEAELRLAALKRVSRQAFVLDRVTSDADGSVRLAALDRIEDETQLARVAERTRKTDKTISRLAAERIDDLRVARGDADAIVERARSLCERLERLLREGDGSDEADRIAAAWASIAERAPAALATRYRNARELFELSRDPEQVARLRRRAEERAQLEEELASIEKAIAAPGARAQFEDLRLRFDALAERHAAFANADDETAANFSVRFTRLGAQLAAMTPPPPTEADMQVQADRQAQQVQRERDAESAARSAANREAREQKQKATIGELQAAIEATTAAIEAGNSAEAHAGHATVTRLRRQLGGTPPALRDAVADLESAYAKIAEWQRWSDNQRRQQLCDELEILPQAGLHPDALATRLREIQAEWAHLDRIEARSAHADGIGRRFHALCRKAIEPAKPYFEKRDALRKQGTQETSELIAQARADAASEEADWRSLSALRKQLADALRSLDRVDPRERKNLAAEIKGALGAIDARVATQNAGVESAKNDLIARALALAEEADLRAAMNQARDLQKLWQKAGNGRRARDQAQWKAFRAAVDAVFGRADDERKQRSEQESQALQAAGALCSELEALAKGSAAVERGELQRIEKAWQSLAVGDAALRQRYQSALSSIRDLEARLQKQKYRAQFDIWLAHYEVLRRLESGRIDLAAFDAERAALPELVLSADEALARVEAVREGIESEPGDSDLLRDCVLEIEQLAGIEPPAEDRQRRMDLQVEKLSARMRGVHAPAADVALQEALCEWLRLGPPPADSEPLESRFRRAVIATLDTIG